MGKMKELYMELQEQEEQLSNYYRKSSAFSDIQCINCSYYSVEKVTDNSYECLHCGIHLTKVNDSMIIVE